jgi:hypothetical protein
LTLARRSTSLPGKPAGRSFPGRRVMGVMSGTADLRRPWKQ